MNTIANSATFKPSDLGSLIADFGDGMTAYANATNDKVAIFADFDDDEVFQVSNWTAPGTSGMTLSAIANKLFNA